MVRDMKFHIYDEEHAPLCWEGKALEFDTRDAVHAFLRDVDEELLECSVIVEDILYYDGGYINATNLRISEDGEELVSEEGLAMMFDNWAAAAKHCEKVFGSYVDWEDEYFLCPECGEPIYKWDWEEDHNWSMCPVCETNWEEIE